MSHYRAQTELALSALGMFSQMASQRRSDEHRLALAGLRAGTMAHVIDALVSRRVEAVKDSFALLLGEYAGHARHLMEQQRQYADAELDSTDPFRRVELRARIQKIDTELTLIRIDSQHLYARMTDVILMLGGSPCRFADEWSQPLALPSR